MNHDQTLRWVLILVFVVVLPVGLYHRLRSESTREKLDRRQEGLFILSTLRPLGAAFGLGLIAWMINPDSMAWSAFQLPAWLRWSGVALLAGCRAASVDLPVPGIESDGHCCHTPAAYVDLTRSLSLDPSPVLRLCGIAHGGDFSNHGELVPVRHRLDRVHPAHHSNTD